MRGAPIRLTSGTGEYIVSTLSVSYENFIRSARDSTSLKPFFIFFTKDSQTFSAIDLNLFFVAMISWLLPNVTKSVYVNVSFIVPSDAVTRLPFTEVGGADPLGQSPGVELNDEPHVVLSNCPNVFSSLDVSIHG